MSGTSRLAVDSGPPDRPVTHAEQMSPIPGDTQAVTTNIIGLIREKSQFKETASGEKIQVIQVLSASAHCMLCSYPKAGLSREHILAGTRGRAFCKKLNPSRTNLATCPLSSVSQTSAFV